MSGIAQRYHFAEIAATGNAIQVLGSNHVYINTDGPQIQARTPARIGDFPDLLSARFTGREDELQKIREIFQTERSGPVRCVIHGIPGLGKTQLAIKFATLAYSEEEYPYVFWISAATSESLMQAFSRVLHLLHLPGRNSADSIAKSIELRAWLEDEQSESRRRWLMVFDNVNDKTAPILRDLIPTRNPNGRILITTRTISTANYLAATAGECHSLLPLLGLRLEDATTLLCISPNDRPEISTEMSSSDAADLARALGCLPLAVEHAASYMRESGCSTTETIELYQSRNESMLSLEADLPHYEQKSVMAAFRLSLEQLAKEPTEVADLLRMLSFLNPEDIPLSLIFDGAKYWYDWPSKQKPTTDAVSSLPDKVKAMLSWVTGGGQSNERLPSTVPGPEQTAEFWAAFCSKARLLNMLHRLQRLSLLTLMKGSQGTRIWIHDVVQLLLRNEVVPQDDQELWVKSAVQLVAGALSNKEPPISTDAALDFETYVLHVQSVTYFADRMQIRDPGLVAGNQAIVNFFYRQGRYSDAERLAKEVWKSMILLYGPSHRFTQECAFGVTSILAVQDKLDEAGEIWRDKIKVQKQILGPNHVETLHSMSEYANILERQGKRHEAVRMAHNAFTKLEKQIGWDDWRTILAGDRYAQVLTTLVRMKEAESLMKRVLKAYIDRTGPNSKDTIICQSWMSSIYSIQGREEEACVISSDVVNKFRQLLGNSHPDLASALCILAGLQGELGRNEEAIASFEEALRIYGALPGGELSERYREAKEDLEILRWGVD